MTKLLSAQDRVSGQFPLVINGARTDLTEGQNFSDTASILAALDAAGVTYEAVPLTALTGTASGRIRIPFTGSRVAVGVNGTQQYLATNAWFTPGTGVVSALDHSSIAYEIEYVDQTPDAFTFTDVTGVTTGSTQTSNTITVAGLDAGVSVAVSVTGGTYSKNGGSYVSSAGTAVNGDTFSVQQTASGSSATAVNTVLTIGGVSDTFTSTTSASTPGPELYPQPTYDASTGLVLVRMSVTGGQLVGNNSGLIPCTCTATLAGGTFTAGDQVQYSLDVIATNASDTISLLVAGNSVASNVATLNGTKTVSGTATLASATNQDIVIKINNNDVGVVKFDNASIKKLS